MAEVIVFPKKEDFSFRSKLIDALLDVRLTLSIKKITSDFIRKSEFKKILDDVKEKTQELEVKNALDEVFSEYFNKNQVTNLKDESLSIEQMKDTIDEETYQDSSNNKGRSFVKTDVQHKSASWDGNLHQGNNAA